MARWRRVRFEHDSAMLAVSAALLVIFSIDHSGFLTADRLLSLLRYASVLGIFGIVVAVVAIARAINLAIVAGMAMSSSWALVLGGNGMSFGLALLTGAGFMAIFGFVISVLIACIDGPPLFTTWAMTSSVYGIGRQFLVESDSRYLPPSGEVLNLLGGDLVGNPIPVFLFGLSALIGSFFHRRTQIGRFSYRIGDNPEAARIACIMIRPITVRLYMLSSLVAFVAGLWKLSTFLMLPRLCETVNCRHPVPQRMSIGRRSLGIWWVSHSPKSYPNPRFLRARCASPAETICRSRGFPWAVWSTVTPSRSIRDR
jgi:ribose transport system permease protein